MARERTGSIYKRKTDKKLFACVTWTDKETGRRKKQYKRAKSISHARELLKEMIREGDDHGFESLNTNRLTFEYLANYFEKNF